MTEETKNQNLESLSQAWSEKIKNIRRFVKDGQTDLEDSTVESPVKKHQAIVSSSDSVPEQASTDVAVQDIFAGDEAFYQSLSDMSAQGAVSASEPRSPGEPDRSRSGSKMLVGGLVLMSVAVMVCGILFFIISFRLTDLSPQMAATPNVPSVAIVRDQQEEPVAEPLTNTEEPISLKIAQNYYRRAQYQQAFTVYERLLENISDTPEQMPLRDFLQLNQALCLQKAGQPQASADLLKTVSQSPSPAVRILANYHLCLYELRSKQFLTARRRAYQAIGLLDTVVSDKDWPVEIRRNCYFLAAAAVTRQTLASADADGSFPAGLWPRFDEQIALLADLDQDALSRVLTAGTKQLDTARLGPIVENVVRDDISYWTVTCNKASIGEVMNRFCANAGYDVCWRTDSPEAGLRNRSICLSIKAVHKHHLVTTVAGSAGLLSYFDDNNVLTICNPESLDLLSDQVSLLSAETVSSWQRYLLTFQQEPYCEYAHFALGLLKAQQGLTAEALAAYKTVSGRYSDSVLGPYALTCSANLKTGLHDYQGAYQDLKEVVEQYPDYEQLGQTYLSMAQATDRIGRHEEAARIYCKVYYLNESPEFQSAGALAAGQLFYEEHNYAEAEKWITRYINLTQDEMNQEFYQACLLLGKTWLSMGKSELAYDALGTALSGRLSRQDYLETVSTLVDGYMQHNRYIEALQVLSDASSQQLPQAESTDLLILESKVLCGMGLTDKAVSLLSSREKYVIDEELAARIGYAISECYIEQSQLELAHKKLASILETVGTGPIAHKTTLKLMDVCIQLGRDEQVIRLGSELLKAQPDDNVKQQASVLLARVYRKQENYERAALTLLGRAE